MIHYHGTPGSSKVNASRYLAGRHALVSHANPEFVAIAAEVCQSFVLDNGAFTHWKAGKPKTNWGDYYNWSALWLSRPCCDWALIPDVIGGTAEDNDRLLAEWPHGKAFGVPVYHMHEPVSRLAALAIDWPRVALGSSGDFAQIGTSAWWNRMGEMMAAVCDNQGRPRCRLHGLRMLDWRIFTLLPLASADSVNMAMNCGRSADTHNLGDDVVTGAAIIASRIEAHNSAAKWTPVCPPMDAQMSLNFDGSADEMARGSESLETAEPAPLGARK